MGEMGDMGDMGDMGSEDDEGADCNNDGDEPPADLPEGVTKEIVKEADEAEYKNPRKGDDVTVHYVGTLLSDGSPFDSSRERAEPFVFALGKGQVIKGWDLGVATMRKGEIAKFTLAPEFAYGDAGSPPKIPEKATLVFEVELISWVSKDDLFGDEGVIKTQVKEGSGWRVPKAADEVRLSLKVLKPDGSVLEEKAEVDYVLGAPDLGPLGKACDKALGSMKRGETTLLRCTKDYMYGDERTPEGGTIELTLHEVFDTRDVSLQKDKSVMKKQVKEGAGYDMCTDASKAKLKVEAMTADGVAVPGFVPKTLEFSVGGGEVADIFEFVVTDMKKGERAVVTCSRPSICAEPQLGVGEATKCEKVVLTLELEDFEKGKDTWSMSEEEKVDFGAARKEVAGNLFKQGRAELALERYKKVIDLFGHIDNYKAENKTRAEDLKRLCQLNKAACHLRLKQNAEAKKACEEVLKSEASNVKAIFRRAQALLGLAEFGDCLRDVKRLLELDPQNREARMLLKQARAGQKSEDDKSKGLFAKMCKGLSSPANPCKMAPDAPAGEAAEEDNPWKEDEPMAGKEAAEAEAGGDEPMEAVPAASLLKPMGAW